MVALIIIAVLAVAMIALFWYGLRGRSNEPPALGSNRPFPEGYWPEPIVSEDEEARDEADQRLAEEKRRRHREPGL
ncbi:MAG: hypothetical protein JOY80_01295 [Candidatus Dormibacteraeota bacterium]|nr:hypothetical protein [Candidatus Dormibacteraeota bacterium]